MTRDRRIWQVQKCEGSEYVVSILNLLLPEYIRIFGRDIMMAAPCIVYNDPTAQSPRFNHTEPLSIRLNQTSLSFWAQTIYQLSHELCHYAMYQAKHDKLFTLSWFEEIVCEAMSLYALQYAAHNWHKCELYYWNNDFDKSILDYLDNELSNTASDGFMRCNTVDKLKSYELGKQPENNRITHAAERNRIYEAISKDPIEARCFLYYQWYMRGDGVTFDFTQWRKDDPTNMVVQLMNIYPIIEKDHNSDDVAEKCGQKT